ncbi:aminotransferase class I/II-fold pyridoxal phosphate-dependent enzyme [Pontimicrobium sp. MEBiC06410]
MKSFPKKLQQKLDNRKASNALRQLGTQKDLVDFSSNDYLGFSANEDLFKHTHQYLTENNLTKNGATGSRLLTGNHLLYKIVETQLSQYHNSENALLFNSGYDANLGFFSSVPQRGDIIFYDEYIHASIRDGITMSTARSYKFKHNNLNNLKTLAQRHSELVSEPYQTIYIVTESVFSMDGDTPNLKALATFCTENNYHLIIDEAHALGVFGTNGVGLVQDLAIEQLVFARIVTFGKAMGCHGAAVLGSTALKNYLINFSRTFIYTTGLPPHSVATIKTAYKELLQTDAIAQLKHNIHFFNSEIEKNQLQQIFITSNSAIQCCIISGNNTVKTIANTIQHNGFSVKPVLSPTVPKGQERLRFCLHAYNSKKEISEVLSLLSTFV